MRYGGRKENSETFAQSTDRYTFRKPFYDKRVKRWYYRKVDKVTGKVTRVRLDAENKTEAKKEVNAERKAQKRLEKATKTTIERKSLEDALAEWHDMRKHQFRPEHAYNLSTYCCVRESKTAQGRPRIRRGLYLRAFETDMPPSFRVKYVDEVTLDHIEKLFGKLWRKKSGRTLKGHYENLRKFFGWCVNHGYTAVNPVEKYERPTTWQTDIKAGKDKGQALTFKQCQRLLKACRTAHEVTHSGGPGRRKGTEWTQTHTPGKHLHTAVLIALRTGLRLGNITGLTWKHLDLANGSITFAGKEMKNRRKFTAPLHPEIHNHLRQLLKDRTEELGHAPKPDERILDVGEFKNGFKGALKRSGIEDENPGFRIHDLRHTFGTLLAEHCPYAVLQQLMGHSVNSVTDRYAMKVPMDKLREHLERLPWLEPEKKLSRKEVDS